ncbi:monovalent cation/H(+) antiporter subunit G [Nigerium massiliense]|uniref:monovalent cation/H(+) antiporter subunit G n=1 Tax=Nigerium massiliense TaxID=1522317 RepID=UPI0009077C4A|nr:monovalent cation/H(+) antiporter subunit G [Nigerium massiliense]
MDEILGLIEALLLAFGAFFCFAAALGLVRFPDVMARLHAATKPQVFGLVLILGAQALALRTWHTTFVCLLIIALQILTNPVAGNTVARTAYRTNQWDSEHAVSDSLARDLSGAGFVNVAENVPLRDADHPDGGEQFGEQEPEGGSRRARREGRGGAARDRGDRDAR